jgi:hypothetical protein
MLVLLGSKRRCCDGITRRESLRAGGLSVLGGFFNLPSLLALEGSPGAHTRPGKAKSVIVLYLYGGAPWQDMLDMKPDAPAEVRGEFKPVPSNVPGITVCEVLPRLGRWMHKAAVVRSVHHRGGDHNPLPSYTGDERPADSTFTLDTYPPSMGSVCEYLKRGRSQLPAYVYLPNYLGWGQVIRRPGPYAGFLGKRYDPLFTECSPYVDPRPATPHIWDTYPIRGEPRLPESDLREGITIDRLDTRRTLLEQIDDRLRRLGASPGLAAHDRVRQQAFSILTSPRVKAAFDLTKEDARLRDRYGRTLFGASTLVARKLVEAGVRFVNVTWDLYWDRLQLGGPSWDTHGRNFVLLREQLLPYFDLAYSALMDDLDSRGLLDQTLVVVMSEMGRTPWINADAGRDHWTGCYSVLFAGAGVRGGTVYGASDGLAAYVKDKPVSPGDICATIYECLGIDPEMPVHDHAGRPVPIANGGRPIGDILG